MLSSIEPFASTEIAYRRQRMTADFRRANALRTSRREGRRGKVADRAPRSVFRPARARG